ncbi:hypothetical protein B296_00015373 [Ensete ventricosum]|uniref:Uncharacterized protein n=1 Tax=Ensete ventricosum TaxID=4639 RepID=A0A426ZV36_ENSVE|nr:hypothetical protein B296_00015373 [Ensete ventricosum]
MPNISPSIIHGWRRPASPLGVDALRFTRKRYRQTSMEIRKKIGHGCGAVRCSAVQRRKHLQALAWLFGFLPITRLWNVTGLTLDGSVKCPIDVEEEDDDDKIQVEETYMEGKGRRIWLKCTMLGDSDEDVDGVEREGEDEVDDDGKMKMGTGKKIRKMMGYSSTRSRGDIFFHSERGDVNVSLSPVNDPSLTLILPFEGLKLLAVTGHGSEIIITEDFEYLDPLLGEFVEVTRDLGVPY